jgi:hypothetical protein
VLVSALRQAAGFSLLPWREKVPEGRLRGPAERPHSSTTLHATATKLVKPARASIRCVATPTDQRPGFPLSRERRPHEISEFPIGSPGPPYARRCWACAGQRIAPSRGLFPSPLEGEGARRAVEGASRASAFIYHPPRDCHKARQARPRKHPVRRNTDGSAPWVPAFAGTTTTRDFGISDRFSWAALRSKVLGVCWSAHCAKPRAFPFSPGGRRCPKGG